MQLLDVVVAQIFMSLKAIHDNAASVQQGEPSLEERLMAWRKEQYFIASQVIVKEDPLLSLSEIDRFKCKLLDNNRSCLYGGVDVSFPASIESSDPSVAVYVIVDSQTNQVVYHDYEYFRLKVPYVSSYLSFREIDPLVRLVKKQVASRRDLTPQAILVDGNGILHARRAGIACFLGVRTGIPTIGVGKSLYCQDGLSKEFVQHGIDASLEALTKEICQNTEWRGLLKNQKETVLLVDKQCIDANVSLDVTSNMDREECVHELSNYCQGVAMKLRGNDGQVLAAALVGHGGGITAPKQGCGTKVPIYISVGHNISLEEAVEICTFLSIARIPEPVRQADLSGRELLRAKTKVK